MWIGLTGNVKMADEQEMDREGFLKLAKYPLIKHTDMLEEMRIEAVELCVLGNLISYL